MLGHGLDLANILPFPLADVPTVSFLLTNFVQPPNFPVPVISSAGESGIMAQRHIKLVAVAVAALIAGCATASPTHAPVPINARAVDGAGVHLVDCRPRDETNVSDSGQLWMSLVIVSPPFITHPPFKL